MVSINFFSFFFLLFYYIFFSFFFFFHPFLVHSNRSTEILHRSNDLLGLVLGDGLLHGLGRALDELLAVHQAQPEHRLHFLDDFWLRGSVESAPLAAPPPVLMVEGSKDALARWAFAWDVRSCEDVVDT